MWLADKQFELPSNWTGVSNKVGGECVYIYIVYFVQDVSCAFNWSLTGFIIWKRATGTFCCFYVALKKESPPDSEPREGE